MQFNGIYSINFDECFVLSFYIYKYDTYFSHLSLHCVSNINEFIYKLLGHSNNLVMAQNPKSENDVRSLQQWYPKYMEHLFNAIRYIPEVHSNTSCLLNYVQYIWEEETKWRTPVSLWAVTRNYSIQPTKTGDKLYYGWKYYPEYVINKLWDMHICAVNVWWTVIVLWWAIREYQ